MIAFMIDQYGKNWIKISEEIKILDPIQIRNRFYSYIRKENRYNTLVNEGKKLMNKSAEDLFLSSSEDEPTGADADDGLNFLKID
mmetsp:Transcript_12417/g.10695  ORF Transcript_12417/g.10695 Transcript_12417/m.10695 type:complete len:85 (+) Transcript_12417:283-537(+)|eukprot:CAMPEP_0114583300 /NCGR_PEP_ID=MMETSP0125-20121206/7066_1 /TAXON_ID=485358 ORGANISM="Aristerostoma sp., Strain ATCC 50986" /NCGR_SAMPLE_ID=MMETSP0125 /ASSEMBLY_ACC=CAM_ASM_000245 /LENGTH=84 /DNA_ID=CAMNT_0001776685 /DNA_START=654 /DNA_END=908 /DNA_ORIENTATION=+